MRTACKDGFTLPSSLGLLILASPCWDAATCSLGLVLPPYNEYFIQADLSDVMLQLQCEYRESCRDSVWWDATQRGDQQNWHHPLPWYRYAVAPAQLLWILRTRVSGSQVTTISLYISKSVSEGKVFSIYVLFSYREYCKRLNLSDNNTQFLQNFLSLMLDISPESDECECVNSIPQLTIFATAVDAQRSS